MTSPRTYISPGSVDEEDLITGEIIPGTWRNQSSLMHPVRTLYLSNNYGKNGEEVRKWYSKQFMGPLAVPWQMKFVSYHCEGDDNDNDCANVTVDK